MQPPLSTLYVCWYDKRRHVILVVGRLRVQEEKPQERYEFRYVQQALDAQKNGFHPFEAFPELHTPYYSDRLFPFFANRVIPTNRPDYLANLAELGLDPTDGNPINVLARMGGSKPTYSEPIEIFATPALDPVTGQHVSDFLIRGVRYFPGAEQRITTLAQGEKLLCMHDFQNPYNRRAIALRTEDNYLLGYVPDYLTDDFSRLLGKSEPPVVTVSKVNLPPAPRHHRVLCRVHLKLESDAHDSRFLPLEKS
ncbi:MAG: HIRAN domain-containing protein [Nannocystaceae bacterium]